MSRSVRKIGFVKDKSRNNRRWYNKVYRGAVRNDLRRKLKYDDFGCVDLKMNKEIILDWDVCDYKWAYSWELTCDRKRKKFKNSNESVLKDPKGRSYFNK